MRIKKRNKKIHFIGIGGAGMNALARILCQQGHRVSGSDIKMQEALEQLKCEGITLYIGHRAQNVGRIDEVIYSSAIPADNVELKVARRRGMRILHRAEALAELMQSRTGIVITGMHGKTTTTGLTAHLLTKAGLAPGYMIGADCPSLNGGAELGKGKYFVAEADESDGSFIQYHPRYALITNIDREHLDYYGGIRQIRAAFKQFFNQVRRKGGQLIVPRADTHVRSILRKGNHKNCIWYGLGRGSDVRAEDVRLDRLSSSFLCYTPSGKLGRIHLALPGRHNVLNALGVIALGWKLRCRKEMLLNGLRGFAGPRRRFEIKLLTAGLMVVDDYAHHPAEIDAVLACCRKTQRRVVGIFQPHRYSRTKLLAEGFGRSLAGLDELILMDIYGADESPVRGVSSEAIRQSVAAHGLKSIMVGRHKSQIMKHLHKIIRPRDLVITLGAGDVGELSDALVKAVSIPLSS